MNIHHDLKRIKRVVLREGSNSDDTWCTLSINIIFMVSWPPNSMISLKIVMMFSWCFGSHSCILPSEKEDTVSNTKRRLPAQLDLFNDMTWIHTDISYLKSDQPVAFHKTEHVFQKHTFFWACAEQRRHRATIMVAWVTICTLPCAGIAIETYGSPHSLR